MLLRRTYPWIPDWKAKFVVIFQRSQHHRFWPLPWDTRHSTFTHQWHFTPAHCLNTHIIALRHTTQHIYSPMTLHSSTPPQYTHHCLETHDTAHLLTNDTSLQHTASIHTLPWDTRHSTFTHQWHFTPAHHFNTHIQTLLHQPSFIMIINYTNHDLNYNVHGAEIILN